MNKKWSDVSIEVKSNLNGSERVMLLDERVNKLATIHDAKSSVVFSDFNSNGFTLSGPGSTLPTLGRQFVIPAGALKGTERIFLTMDYTVISQTQSGASAFPVSVRVNGYNVVDFKVNTVFGTHQIGPPSVDQGSYVLEFISAPYDIGRFMVIGGMDNTPYSAIDLTAPIVIEVYHATRDESDVVGVNQYRLFAV